MANASRGQQNSIVEYLQNTRAELRRVVWPTREETINLTIVVLVVTIAMTLLLGGLDYIFSQLLDLVLSIAEGGL